MTIFNDPSTDITVYIYRTTTEYHNISNLISSAKITGDINTLPRSLEVGFYNSNDLMSGKILVNYDVGNLVIAYVNGTEVFRGNIFKTTIKEDSSATLVAYDELVYLTKNSDSILIKKQKASDVIRTLANKYDIKFSSIEDTGYIIKKLACDQQDLATIIQNCLDETKINTGRSYWIYSKKGTAYLVSRGASSKLVVTTDEIINAERDISIEDTRNEVVIEKGTLDPSSKSDKPFKTVMVSDNTAKSKYGTMRHVETAQNGDSDTTAKMTAQAKTVLATLKNPTITMSVTMPGNIECTTCNRITVNDTVTGISGTYYITADEHDWSNSGYTMTLQLSKTLV